MAEDEITYTDRVDIAGNATVVIEVRNRISTWTIKQISTEMLAAPSGATCMVRKNGYLISPAIAKGDVVSGDPPVMLRPGDMMTVEWANCTPGDTGRVLVILDDGS